MARASARPSNWRHWLLARARWPMRTAFPSERRSMIGMCDATNPVDDVLVSVAKSYLSMNDARVFSSETANDAGTYIFSFRAACQAADSDSSNDLAYRTRS